MRADSTLSLGTGSRESTATTAYTYRVPGATVMSVNCVSITGAALSGSSVASALVPRKTT